METNDLNRDDFVRNGYFGAQLPRVPGHEIVGRIIKFGPKSILSGSRFREGQRVGVGWHGGHCFECLSCRDGDFITCSSGGITGITSDGGYAEYVVAKLDALALVVDDKLTSEEVAPLLCAGVTVFNSLRNAGLKPGAKVGVQGIGGLGHLAIQFARKSGFKTVALSSSMAKEALARELGAHEYFDLSNKDHVVAIQSSGGLDAVLATAPYGKAITGLQDLMAVNGKIIILAAADDFSLTPGNLIMKRLTVQGWPSGSAEDSEQTINAASLLDVKTQVEVFPLEKAEEAFQKMMKNEARFRCVLKM